MRIRALIAASLLSAVAIAASMSALTASRGLDARRVLSALPNVDLNSRAALLADLSDDGEAAFLVVLDRQADLRPASGLPDKTAKGRFAWNALRAVAAETQPELIAALKARGARVRSFVVVNAIGVRGNLQSIVAAAAFPHTARIVADTPFSAGLSDTPAQQSTINNQQSSISNRLSAIEWGVSEVNAPLAWSMGYSGTGIVVGGQDTGVRWDHTALIDRYRGWNGSSADHNFNWHDSIHADLNGSGGNPCGFSVAAPCDDHSHGTHTLGTVAGDDGGDNQIGVAPGAQWIACRNMDEGWGAPSSYLECFEWFLAPYPITGTPADGDPDRAPHAINNSWSCPDYEGCLTGQEVLSGVLAMRAAGILTVVSAGNEGPACGSVVDPPAMYAESFSVGAYSSGGSIASFSSRGPVTRDGSQRLKPDIAAPGVSVRSATNGSTTSYGFSNGTSMAAPHVAGAAALLWDAAPYLIGEVDLSEWVLRLNARPAFTTQGCGGDTPASHPNNVWGWGKVDAWAAISATFSLTPTASLTFTLVTSDSVVLDASASSDPETPAADLLARWDFGGDGVWDTPWSFTKTVTVTSDVFFPATVVQIADWGGRSDVDVAIHPDLNRRYNLPVVLK